MSNEHDLFTMTEDRKRIAFSHFKGGFSKVIIMAHGYYNNKDTVLFLHGEKDWLIKPGHSQRLLARAKEPKALAILNDGGHAERMFDEFPDRFMKICLDRFKETL